MWRRPLGLLLLLLLLLAGELGVGARRGRRRRELAPALHQRGIRDAGGRYCQEQDLCCRGRRHLPGRKEAGEEPTSPVTQVLQLRCHEECKMFACAKLGCTPPLSDQSWIQSCIQTNFCISVISTRD